MPQMAPIVLKDGQAADVTFNPSGFDGATATFINNAPARVSEWERLSIQVRPNASNNEGHKVTVTGILPIPAPTGTGCCVDPNGALPYGMFQVTTLRQKTMSAAEVDDMIAYLRSYVATTAFADLVKGSGYY